MREDPDMKLAPAGNYIHITKIHSVWKSLKKVSFNIVSEASYVYILSEQKFVKNAKDGPFFRVCEKWDIFGDFQT